MSRPPKTEANPRLAELFADAVRDKPDRSHWLGLWNEALNYQPPLPPPDTKTKPR